MKLTKNIQTIARRTLLKEAEAIQKVTAFIDDKFELIVSEILAMNGRVIVTGIGKSAIVANKIVATLNSTGTPSIFMHAADAIHGDLGMIQADDMVMCISKSGNTEEIKVLIPLIKHSGAKVIGLVSNMDSYVAKHADFVLNGTIDEEADPNNLAPTTSTTVHMAIGDALAISLLNARGFTSRDFAKYHPGGSLGKQLYLKVDDIYPKNELPIVVQTALVKDSILEISRKRLGAAAVVDEKSALVGIFTDGDLRRMLEKHTDFSHITIGEVMTPNPKTINKGEYAIHALNKMREFDINQLIVVHESSVVGFLHISDLLNEGIV
ncbi:arabinose-5-phosphate isomerase [Roseivirga pacifica]|uniref:Arabinose-5-phosphate isomerase n=1 Tax=Roseivirga pacifica TaxID=1267423 RepID=A0A1I0MAX4_9BACT|nr:KpsF/GutQ family sugar-phosphate isomerase [Roseivirga pacifica]MCO6358742.1 KpsF/GutQ family sugar-phosphate isomerase [Roseivirga pacifica]MCO6365622.1 KpsF/GutQ family sugar-phosphate isomerase [Roseivirga pacifica]MCO6371648.1 KpsF/GutQ family sugar-phosphate isomerase [Roseivirga pacifica]MCO6376241.1 KpsF/GutQ family sugar-phosphate isomerase [Roseivirga pacifica]MCO6379026.1 KpsF/GutQ family sugar-phosphate isomerase [Roseivirga pacifica]